MARGDDRALDAFYTRFGHLAYGLALELVRDEQAAQAIVVAAFSHVWATANAPASSEGPRARLLHDVHVRAADHVRKADVRPTRLRASDEPQPSWISLEGRAALALLDQLPDDDREAIELAYYSCYTRDELGPILGVSVEVVTARITNGLRRLGELQLQADPVRLEDAAQGQPIVRAIRADDAEPGGSQARRRRSPRR